MDKSINMKKFGVVLCGKIDHIGLLELSRVEARHNYSHGKKIKLAGSKKCTEQTRTI